MSGPIPAPPTFHSDAPTSGASDSKVAAMTDPND